MEVKTDEVQESQKQPLIPLHLWTHNGNKVLYVKCVDKGGKGYGGFQWPRSGKIQCPRAKANREAAAKVTGDVNIDCSSGGTFGWPWGLNLGGGKEPDCHGDWIVFAVDPVDSIDLGDKAKAIGEVEVVYYGDAFGALMYTFAGRLAWTEHAAKFQNKFGTGYSSAVSGTGYSSAVSGTGDCSAVSGTGNRSAVSGTGNCSIAAITGENSTLEVGEKSLGASTAQCWTWKVHKGSVVACRWQDGDTWHQRLLIADELGFGDGDVADVIKGNPVKRE